VNSHSRVRAELLPKLNFVKCERHAKKPSGAVYFTEFFCHFILVVQRLFTIMGEGGQPRNAWPV